MSKDSVVVFMDKTISIGSVPYSSVNALVQNAKEEFNSKKDLSLLVFIVAPGRSVVFEGGGMTALPAVEINPMASGLVYRIDSRAIYEEILKSNLVTAEYPWLEELVRNKETASVFDTPPVEIAPETYSPVSSKVTVYSSIFVHDSVLDDLNPEALAKSMSSIRKNLGHHAAKRSNHLGGFVAILNTDTEFTLKGVKSPDPLYGLRFANGYCAYIFWVDGVDQYCAFTGGGGLVKSNPGYHLKATQEDSVTIKAQSQTNDGYTQRLAKARSEERELAKLLKIGAIEIDEMRQKRMKRILRKLEVGDPVVLEHRVTHVVYNAKLRTDTIELIPLDNPQNVKVVSRDIFETMFY